jgi:phosphoglycerate-specific signal transduction histidine kinase
MDELVGQALSESSASATAQAQFLYTAKLTTLGEMAAGLAHELNQPLNNMKVIAQTILRNVKKQRALDPEQIANELEIMITQIKRMTGTIEHLRQFS